MAAFEARVGSTSSRELDQIILVVEHEQGSFHYFCEATINRTHKIGAHPIEIKISATLKDFSSKENTSAEEIENRMKKIFESSETHQNYSEEKLQEFDQFVGSIKSAIATSIKVDDIKLESSARIIRPKKPSKGKARFSQSSATDPYFYGYYDSDDSFGYCWTWGDQCHHHHIHCSNMTLVDEYGSAVMTIDDTGITAGEDNTFNSEQTFEAVQQEGVEFHENNDYSPAIEESMSGSVTADDTTSSSSDVGGGGGFSFGDFFDGGGDSGGGDSSDSGSSCGGCGGD